MKQNDSNETVKTVTSEVIEFVILERNCFRYNGKKSGLLQAE